MKCYGCWANSIALQRSERVSHDRREVFFTYQIPALTQRESNLNTYYRNEQNEDTGKHTKIMLRNSNQNLRLHTMNIYIEIGIFEDILTFDYSPLRSLKLKRRLERNIHYAIAIT